MRDDRMDGRAIKVLQILLSLEYGGAEKVAVNLINSLQGEKFGFSVCALDRIGNLRDQLKDDVDIRCLDRRGGIDFSLPFRLKNAINELSPDVVHIHNVAPFFYGVIGARLAGVKNIVLTQHGSAIKSVQMRFALRHLSRYVSRAVAVSSNTRDYLFSHYGLGQDKIAVIENGADESLREKDKTGRAQVRERLGIRDELVIGNVARLSPEKDHSALLRAFADTSRRITNAKLVIVGEGVLKEDLMNLSDELNISDKVVFAGGQSDVAPFLKAFDLFVLSSYREGMPLTVLEAMACELPVVSTNVGGISSMLTHNETGILVPPRDHMAMSEAIVGLLNNKPLRQRLGSAGRKRMVENFSLSRMAGKYAEIYTELAKR